MKKINKYDKYFNEEQLVETVTLFLVLALSASLSLVKQDLTASLKSKVTTTFTQPQNNTTKSYLPFDNAKKGFIASISEGMIYTAIKKRPKI